MQIGSKEELRLEGHIPLLVNNPGFGIAPSRYAAARASR